MEDRNIILSIKDLEVKFRVRGRILTAIRGVSLDVYENESIAIVGESGSGKSVFTKTFAGMLDSNGFISNGRIIFDDPELADTHLNKSSSFAGLITHAEEKLNEFAKLQHGSQTYKALLDLESENNARKVLSDEEDKAFTVRIDEIQYQKAETFNLKQTLDTKTEKDRIKELALKIKDYDRQLKKVEEEKRSAIAEHKKLYEADEAYKKSYADRKAELEHRYAEEIKADITEGDRHRNEILAKEVVLSVGRYPSLKRKKAYNKLLDELKKAYEMGVDLDDETTRNQVFDTVAFRVKYLDETEDKLHGTCILNLANIRNQNDWTEIRGRKIATVFQDPMTSLNPVLTIGKQISSIIMKHQGCQEVEARKRALILMHKVGIPNPEKRYDDYPFQYSGGMRQRIVIAIALSCQPRILICDEPTTALDVTIQAQILQLLKDLQRDLGFTIVFITHDLGVVANIADRVAVMYAGQIVEVGKVDEIFFDSRHPYTWALLQSLPQLATRNTELYSITGTPPSLYNKIVGDPFAPRNPYCMKIDTLKEPPMFRVTDTHYAKTWLLDPRSPEIKRPELIEDIHEKFLGTLNL
ncbi:MAG: ATP-binding cassette domain-containing protein [Lachnospiraceae bacterium]|nr:ATP-binding cassette domain-containing protein [Lachnospiraceae bacterium]